MIPVRLTLRNFMCYRDDSPPIEFAGFHTSVLCGDNGAGKSALLAAMTWALWGEARENVSDEELITQGENDMSVDFMFQLGDQHYRVLRKRSRRNNKGMITFQIGYEDGWRDISGHTARETQKQIIEKLRMDYTTFTNSAFLLQGRADNFTTKTPTERKEILSTILGLGEYDRLADEARAESREREAKRRETGAQIEEMDRQIANRPFAQQDLDESNAALLLAEATLEKAGGDEQILRIQLENLLQQQSELENVRGRMAQDERDAKHLRGDVDILRGQIASYQQLIDIRAQIVSDYNTWKKANEREAALTTALGEQSRLEREQRNFERIIDSARQEITTSVTLREHNIAELNGKIANRAANEATLRKLRADITQYISWDETAQQLRKNREALLQESSGIDGENKKLVERMNELKERRASFELAVAEAEKNGSGHCPMCGVLLDKEGRARVLAAYEVDIAAGRDIYRGNQRRSAEIKQQIAELDAQIAEYDERLRPRKDAERREQDLSRSVREANEAAEKLTQEQALLAKLQAQLDRGDFGGDAREKLIAVQQALSKISYNAEEHQRVSLEKRRLDGSEGKYNQLNQALDNIESARTSLETKEEALRQREARFNKERLIAQELAASIRNLPELQQEVRSKEQEVRSAKLRRAEIADRKSRAEEKLRAIEEATKRKAILGKEFEQASYEKSIYDELAKAFGKSGVQAMIIESVMPELQDEANALLGRMTDNRMFLSFETQRQAKTSDSTIETLDIKISDDSGVARRYELFSGGEAFRINFAVRIALSKLLARRAGAQLQTLIIDEGFGSQDGQGRERLIQAIRSIEDDFEKILIITHIQELKDEFPSRIEVVRTAGGSIVSVV